MQSEIKMPRGRVNFRLDQRILDELEDLAGKGFTNKFVEGLLWDFLQKTGRIPLTAQPLPESRGCKGKGKKAKGGDA
jgi:hypothetical protein